MKATVIHCAYEKAPQVVAEIDVRDDSEASAELCYHLTQNKMGSWSRGESIDFCDNPDYDPRITVMCKLPVHNGKTYGLRSTGVEDQIVIGEKTYIVDDIGFVLK